MLTNVWRRGGLAALTVACAAGVLAAAGVSAGAAAARPQARTSVQAPAQARARVPWAQAGPGWELVTYSTPSSHGTTLYLVAPNGAKYGLHTWRGTTAPGSLVAWSGDKSRALFFNDVNGRVTQLNLMTGKTNSFTLTGQGSPVGYTLPRGLNILAVVRDGGSWALARLSLTGTPQKVLIRGNAADGGVYDPDGQTLAVPGPQGIRLVNNATAAVKNRSVRGTSGCGVSRWWDSRTVLAVCNSTTSGSRLWLVPVSGAAPMALTKPRTSGSDLGDIGAWRLSSGLYLQSLGGCGSIEINQQHTNGNVTPVTVPGTSNIDNAIVTADGQRLLIDASFSPECGTGRGLLWFNPGTHAEKWLFGYSAHARLDVVAFNSIENGPGI